MGVEAPGWQGADEEDTPRYLTSPQRSQAGCIGGKIDPVVHTRALS